METMSCICSRMIQLLVRGMPEQYTLTGTITLADGAE
jgi:hypothetical protein